MPKRKPNRPHKFPPAHAAIESESRTPRPEAYRLGLGPVTFADSGEGQSRRFRLNAYDGSVFAHPFWGKLAIELSSLKVPSGKMPILRQHMHDRIVGFSDKQSKKGGNVVVEGVFSEVTEDGREVEALQAEGFPWEASMAVPPASIEFVQEGKKRKVNGHELEGPGTIFHGSVLEEVSFVALGQVPGTTAERMSAGTPSNRRDIIAAFSAAPTSEQPTIMEDPMANEPTEPKTTEPATEPTEAASATPPPPASPPAAPQAPPASKLAQGDDVDAKIQAALARERQVVTERTTQILEGSYAGQDKLSKQLIADRDKSIPAAMLELKKDHQEHPGGARLDALNQDPAAGIEPKAGGTVTNMTSSPIVTAKDGTRIVQVELAKKKFSEDVEIQAEFQNESNYLAYLNACASGAFKGISRKNVEV